MIKRIGLIGGIGPLSTVDYYNRIVEFFQTNHSGIGYPEIIIYSANLHELMEIMAKNDLFRLVDWLSEKVAALQRAGAEFAVIGSNTPHVVFHRVSSRSPIPMLSIVEETSREAYSRGHKKSGLMGTIFTMESDFYQKAFEEKGMHIVVPEEEDRRLINDRLFSEIERGIIRDSTRKELLDIIEKMIGEHSIDSLILGCTELPLILDKDNFGIPFLNTTAIHVESIVNYCLGRKR